MKNQSGKYLALDFGAESGRAIVVSLEKGQVTLEEIHRFPNKPAMMNGTLYWDLPYLFREVISSLKKASINGVQLDSIAVDTWGVDFGLLDGDDQLIGNPVHYRDERTAEIKENSLLSDEDIFDKTGGLPWNIGSLFQIFSLKIKESVSLNCSRTFLNMPDLFNFLLCGEKRSEITIASTSLIMGKEEQWNKQIIEKFNLPSIFPQLIKPGEILSSLRDDIAGQTGHRGLKVVTTCSHDTASVAAVVPDRASNSAFLSSGTWSILGKIFDKPQTDSKILNAGFTNEASLDSWYLCKNLTGLYPFQELKRSWDLSDDPWDYGRMCSEAASFNFSGLVDLEHADFQSPGDITGKLERHLKANQYNMLGKRGEYARILLDSLALEYAVYLEKLERITGSHLDTLYILGGGIKNTYLCQRTADMCGVKVIAGIDQGTALGNGLVQAYGLGHIDTPDQIRKIASASFDMKTYLPVNNSNNKELADIYREIKNRSTEL